MINRSKPESGGFGTMKRRGQSISPERSGRAGHDCLGALIDFLLQILIGILLLRGDQIASLPER